MKIIPTGSHQSHDDICVTLAVHDNPGITTCASQDILPGYPKSLVKLPKKMKPLIVLIVYLLSLYATLATHLALPPF